MAETLIDELPETDYIIVLTKGMIVQGNHRVELDELRRQGNGSDWWFATEVSVKYSENQIPCHDVAGWRKKRVK